MEFRDGPSWKVSFGDAQVLDIALYIRDVAALAPVNTTQIPRLVPRVEVTDAVTDGSIAADQWGAWWDTAVSVGPAALLDLQPPNFEGFGNAPELQSLLRRHFDSALRWANERARVRDDEHGPPIGRIVRVVEASIGRAAQPFMLRLTRLSVEGKQAWRVADDHVLITDELVSDADSFADTLRPIIESIA